MRPERAPEIRFDGEGRLMERFWCPFRARMRNDLLRHHFAPTRPDLAARKKAGVPPRSREHRHGLPVTSSCRRPPSCRRWPGSSSGQRRMPLRFSAMTSSGLPSGNGRPWILSGLMVNAAPAECQFLRRHRTVGCARSRSKVSLGQACGTAARMHEALARDSGSVPSFTPRPIATPSESIRGSAICMIPECSGDGPGACGLTQMSNL